MCAVALGNVAPGPWASGFLAVVGLPSRPDCSKDELDFFTAMSFRRVGS